MDKEKTTNQEPIHPAFTIYSTTTGRFDPATNGPVVRGRIRCHMSDCENREDVYCSVLSSSNEEDGWNDDDEKCEGYSSKKAKAEAARKARTFSNVTLSHEEIETLLALLSPSAGDTDEPGYGLYTKLADRMHNPIANAMYFINQYEVNQAYGGPEEGGWYYHTTDCIYSLGFDCLVGYQSSEPVKDFNRIVDEFVLVGCDLNSVNDLGPALDKDLIISKLRENNYYVLNDLDKYGEGVRIEITQTCAGAHDTDRQRYE